MSILGELSADSVFGVSGTGEGGAAGGGGWEDVVRKGMLVNVEEGAGEGGGAGGMPAEGAGEIGLDDDWAGDEDAVPMTRSYVSRNFGSRLASVFGSI